MGQQKIYESLVGHLEQIIRVRYPKFKLFTREDSSKCVDLEKTVIYIVFRRRLADEDAKCRAMGAL